MYIYNTFARGPSELVFIGTYEPTAFAGFVCVFVWSLHRLMFPQMHSVPADFTALKGKECKLGKIYSWTSRFSRFT